VTAVEVLQAAVPLTMAGVAAPAMVGGYRWLRQVSSAVDKLTEVSHRLGKVSEAQEETARQARATRRELALHVRQCVHSYAPERAGYLGDDRRRVPAPRSPEAIEP
jgi:hypothetical protein